MRQLIIERRRSAVGCLGTMKLYIEDPTAADLEIDGVSCRKLGVLKNGTTETFAIDNAAAKLFVIAGKLSKNFCRECYVLPEGEEDITLSGQNRFDLAAGHIFRFDNNTSAESLQTRHKTKRTGMIVLALAIVIGFVAGYLIASGLLFPPSPKTFTVDGMSITLTSAFHERDADRYNAFYTSNKVAVLVTKEPFLYADGFEALTLNQYAELLIENNGLSVEPYNDNGTVCFAYHGQHAENQQGYYYVAYTYKTSDAFWLIQFGTEEQHAAEYASQISEWASTVTFTN